MDEPSCIIQVYVVVQILFLIKCLYFNQTISEGEKLLFIGSFGSELWVNVKAEKYEFLNKLQSPKSQCNNGSFFECFNKKALNEVSEKCPRKCLPYSTMNSQITRCDNAKLEEIQCAVSVFQEKKVEIIPRCKHSCSITQYYATYTVGTYTGFAKILLFDP